jgi:UDP-N-acetylglucosamine 3-dehydrogenase
MIKVAISGAGAITQRAHIPALRSVPGLQIVAIQSRTREKIERLVDSDWSADQPRPRIYLDFDAMLEHERPDAVCVFTPNHLHREFTLKALAAGAHVMVEKPMCAATADARAMIQAADRAGRMLMVAMQRRYGGLECVIKDAIATGAIGTPNFIRARLSHGGPHLWAPGQSWFTSAIQAGGGATLDLGVHVADLAIWFMGEVDSVSGAVATLAKKIEVDDTGAMLLQFKSGAIGVLEASWSSMPALSAIEIYGSEGRVMAGYPGIGLAVQNKDGSAAEGFSSDEIASRYDPRDPLAPFRALATNFAAAIAGSAPPFPDGRDGLRAIEVIEACYRSSQTGTRIRLPLDS